MQVRSRSLQAAYNAASSGQEFTLKRPVEAAEQGSELKSSNPTGNEIPPALVEPDAHGQAALLLTESLIHTLVENAALSNVEAIQVVRSAAEVKLEVATAAGESDKRMKESLLLLEKMRSSFEADETEPWQLNGRGET